MHLKRGSVVRKQNTTPVKNRASQKSISKKQRKSEHRIQRCMQKPRFWNSCRLRLAIPLSQNPYLLRAQKIEGQADPVHKYYSLRIKIKRRDKRREERQEKRREETRISTRDLANCARRPKIDDMRIANCARHPKVDLII